MQLRLIENTSDPNGDQLLLVTVDGGQTTKVRLLHKSELAAPMQFRSDPIIALALRVMTGKSKPAEGNWQAIVAALEGIPDVEAAAIEYGTTLEDLLRD